MSNPFPHILYCRCLQAHRVPPALTEAVLENLGNLGLAIETVPDLCELSARRDPALRRLAGAGLLRIAACSPRAVKWLFAAAGAPLSATGCEVLNMRTVSANDAVARLRSPTLTLNLPGTPATPAPRAHVAEPPTSLAPPPPGSWVPWFPVIDYDRCVNCLQCLGFCLFGVYGVDAEGRVRVQQPDHCKTLCPACARVCPEAAIMFPKHTAAAINGDPIDATSPQRETMQVDLHALLQGNVHDLLRLRSDRARTRFDKDRDADQALSERQKCLREYGGLAGDIPPEVLRNLPAPEEIARKAAEAAARVAAARNQTPIPPT